MEQGVANLNQELQTILTLVKWVVAILTPIVTALAFAVWKLWNQGREDRRLCEQELKEQGIKFAQTVVELQNKHEAEMKQCWQMTHDLAVEQGKVIERFLVKTET